MKKVKAIYLWPEDVLSDIDFQLMDAQQRGVFWTIILLLYSNNGRIEYNPGNLAELCGCDDFENVWKKIAKKFQTRNGVIRHKRVTKELKKTKKLMQDRIKAGLKGAQKKWQSHSTANGAANGTAAANENGKERSGTVKQEKEKLRIRENNNLSTAAAHNGSAERLGSRVVSSLQSCRSSHPPRPDLSGRSLASRTLKFNDALRMIITPRSQSDLTSFRNISNWLAGAIAADRFNEEIFERVLDYAKQAADGPARNPAAVFTAILKKELGYRTSG